MAEEGKAFLKGGAGCVVAFFVLALIAVIFGGHAYIDIGGFFILIIIGGVIGLVVNWIYQKGKRDGGGDSR